MGKVVLGETNQLGKFHGGFNLKSYRINLGGFTGRNTPGFRIHTSINKE